MKKTLSLLMTVVMLLSTLVIDSTAAVEWKSVVPVVEEGKTFYEQIDTDRTLGIDSVVMVFMQPVKKDSGKSQSEQYSDYRRSGFFPELFNYGYKGYGFWYNSYTDLNAVVDITWGKYDNGVCFNPPFEELSDGDLIYPVYKVAFDKNSYTLKGVMDLFEGRQDIYMIEPFYEDYSWCRGTVTEGDPVIRYPWYYFHVKYVLDHEIMNGVKGNYDYTKDGYKLPGFLPNNKVTRAQVAQMLYNIHGEPVKVDLPYTDVSESAWYYEAISWAYFRGLMNGVSEDRMDPEGYVTREQFATLMYRFASTYGYCTDVISPVKTDHFDFDRVSDYAVESVKWASESQLMNGWKEEVSNKKICGWYPKSYCTRAQLAKIFKEFHEYHSAYAPESGMTKTEFYRMLHDGCS